jgi:hypothetical protein
MLQKSIEDSMGPTLTSDSAAYSVLRRTAEVFKEQDDNGDANNWLRAKDAFLGLIESTRGFIIGEEGVRSYIHQRLEERAYFNWVDNGGSSEENWEFAVITEANLAYLHYCNLKRQQRTEIAA